MNNKKKIVLGSLAALAVAGMVGGAAAIGTTATTAASFVSDGTSKPKLGETLGFKLHNNSSQRLEFQYVTGKVPAPPVGEVLPGAEVDYELPYSWTTEHSSGDVVYKLVDPAGGQGYTVDLHLDAVNPSNDTFTVTDASGNPVSDYLAFSTEDLATNIVMQDAPGGWANRSPSITPGVNGWTQDEVSGTLQNMASNLTFSNITVDKDARDSKVLVSEYEQGGSGTVGTQTGLETSVTDSWDTGISGSGEIMGAVTAGVSSTVGHSVTTSNNFGTNSSQNTETGYTSVIWGLVPVLRATGDFSGTLGNTQMTFKGASFDYPDTTRPMEYSAENLQGDVTGEPAYQPDSGVNDHGPAVAAKRAVEVKHAER